MVEQLLTPEQVAQVCALGRQAIYREIRRGQLRALKLAGGRLRVPASALADYLDQRVVLPDPAPIADEPAAAKPSVPLTGSVSRLDQIEREARA